LHPKIKTYLKQLIDRGWRSPDAKGSRLEKEKSNSGKNNRPRKKKRDKPVRLTHRTRKPQTKEWK
jgi:hypothetical protein